MTDLMDRLRELLTRHQRHDLLGFDVKQVRGQIDQDRAHKEAELDDLTNFENDLDAVEAAMASFAGGPGADGDDSDDNGDQP